MVARVNSTYTLADLGLAFASCEASSPGVMGWSAVLPTPNAAVSPFTTSLTRGTRILTEFGKRPVETLSVGTRVMTMDNGMQKIRWIGARTVDGRGELAPVRFDKGVIGNSRSFQVSPDHRMLLSGWRVEMLFGCDEVLVVAKDMVNGDTITREPATDVCYMQLVFDQHEVIFAEGAATESFLPSMPDLSAQMEFTRNELVGLFSELSDSTAKSARPALDSSEAKCLLNLSTQMPAQKEIGHKVLAI